MVSFDTQPADTTLATGLKYICLKSGNTAGA